MPGERWPDKRARAVLFAGANRLAREAPHVDPDAIADLGLAVRDLLFVDAEVREDNADTKANRIGYTADCMQFALLEPSTEGPLVSLWVGPERVAAAKEALGATEHPNPFRKMYGWVQVTVPPGGDLSALRDWVEAARRHAAATKTGQHVAM